jgi:hypothetical protein
MLALIEINVMDTPYELFGCVDVNANVNEINLRTLPAGINLN